MLVSLLVALAAATDPAAAVATPPQPPAQTAAAQTATVPAAKPAEDVSDKFVCRTEMVTGSRFPAKVCRRKSEMAQKQQDDQDRIRQQQRFSGPQAH